MIESRRDRDSAAGDTAIERELDNDLDMDAALDEEPAQADEDILDPQAWGAP